MLLSLPEEVLVHIFDYLNLRDLPNLLLVCKSLYRLSEDDQLWKKFFMERYDGTNLSGYSEQGKLKYLFFNKSRIENQLWCGKKAPLTLFENTVLEVTCLQFNSEYVFSGSGVSDVWDFDPTALMAAKTIQVHDINSGKKLQTLTGHSDSITCLQCHDKTIISGSKDSTIRIWNTLEGWNKGSSYQMNILGSHNKPVCSLQWEGRTLITGGRDKEIKIWDLETKKCATSLFNKSVVYSLKFDGNTLATGSKDRKIRLWDLETGKQVRTLCHKAWVSCLQFLNHNRIVAGSGDGRVRVWDLRSSQPVKDIKIDNSIFSLGWITCLACDENKVITGAANKLIKITDLITGKCINTLKGHVDAVTSVQFDDSKIMSGSLDRTVKIWDFSDSGLYSHLSPIDNGKCILA